MKIYSKITLKFLIVPVFSGFLLAVVDKRGDFWRGWFGYCVLFICSLIILNRLSKEFASPGWFNKMVLVVFGSRIALGVMLLLLLPIFGYQDNTASKAGYLFQDAYIRDTRSWELAQSDQSLLVAFQNVYPGDQYGGMMASSALTYRALSPDFHRPLQVIIWLALLGSISTIFIHRAVQNLFTDPSLKNGFKSPGKVASFAAVIFAFYPESFLLGSSHMREPVILLGITALFLGLTETIKNRRRGLVLLGLGAVILLLFHPPICFITLVCVFGIWFLEVRRKASWKLAVFFVGSLLLSVILMISVFRNLPSLQSLGPIETLVHWVELNFNFQSHLAERSSGMVQKLLRSAGENWTLPIVLGYGVVQPVLPAALVDPAAAIWKIINTLRSAGWFALAPLLLYTSFISLKTSYDNKRWHRLWLVMLCLVWILISAAVAGGDQWDNPRYRTVFLPWMATLAGWGWSWARHSHDSWLKRIYVAEIIFILIFLEWYISRYYPIIHFDIRVTIIVSILLPVLYLSGSVVSDLIHRKRKL